MALMEPNIWNETYSIRSYEVDARGRLSVLSLFNFLQDAASKHANELGVSVQHLLSMNYTWVLSRLVLKMESFPSWKDQIHVHTWPSGIEKLFALRDFDIKDVNNNSLGAAVSAWLVIDNSTRRPVRITQFAEKLNPIDIGHVLMNNLDKLPEIKSDMKQFDSEQRLFSVRYRDLDINQHVNNVSYIEWAIESIPKDIQETCVLRELEINFLAEAFLGDNIIARCQPQNENPNVLLHNIVREENEQELVRLKTAWEPIS